MFQPNIFRRQLPPETHVFTAMCVFFAISWGQALWAFEPRSRGYQSLELLRLDSTHRRSLPASEEVELFRLDLTEEGMLSVEVTAPRPGSSALWLDLRPFGLDKIDSGTSRTIFREVDRTRTRWILKILEPGSILVRIASLRPSDVPVAYKLRTAFVAPSGQISAATPALQDPPDSCSEGIPPQLVLEDGDTSTDASGDDSVDPWDCDVWSGLVSQGGVLEMTATGTPIEARVFGGTDCADLRGSGRLTSVSDHLTLAVLRGQYRFAIDSLLGSEGPYSVRYELFPLCSKGEQDDHGDSPSCATPLDSNGAAKGALENEAGDDEDYFGGRLAKPSRFTLEIQSEQKILCQVLGEGDRVIVPWQPCGGSETPSLIRGFGEGELTVAVAMLTAEPADYRVRLVPRR